MKKPISIILAILILLCAFPAAAVSAKETPAVAFNAENALFVHAVEGEDSQAWSAWQCAHDVEYNDVNPSLKYFFLPTSAGENKVDIYNAYSNSVTLNGTQIPAGKVASVSYEENKTYEVSVGDNDFELRFIKSNAEAAVYVNNSDVDGKGTDLFSYLSESKSNSAKAEGAVVTPDGKIDNTSIKKIKGRGNTTWNASKKPFNITYSKPISVAGMNEGKKYSLLANFQDDSLARNRFLYDLSDAVGMPYASDSRFVDFYINGYYWGSYQMCEKIEVGKNSLISDFEEDDYLDENGNVKKDFPFLCEVDAGAKDGEDYYVEVIDGLKVTIKAPELEEGDKGYDEVKEYVEIKFYNFLEAVEQNSSKLENLADIDSLAKMLLINELGKNWDAGVSSFYFTYKPDENGKYKFFASPVWDYDNSLGNANGITEWLEYILMDDYTEPTGDWCWFALPEFMGNSKIEARANELWFEKFVPAIDHFTGKKFDEEINKVFYTADKYFSLLEKSAEMNYTSGWLLYTSSWIADHSRLTNASYDDQTSTYSTNKYPTAYSQTFKGMFDYARDWMVSRAAWMSKTTATKEVAEKVIENEPPATEPTTAEPTTEATEPTTAEPTTEATESTTAEPTTEATESTTTEPTTEATESTTAEPTTEATESTTAEPTTKATESTTAEPTTKATESTTAEPTTEKAEPTTVNTATQPRTAAASPKADNKKTVKPAVKANTIKVTAKAKTVKAKKLAKKAKKIKAITVKNAVGKVTYKLARVPKKIKKLVKINKKGVITLKKGKYAKKTYKIKVKITAAGNKEFTSAEKTVTVKVKVK